MGYTIDLYDAIVVKPALPGEFVRAATHRMRKDAPAADALARWPALERLSDEVPFDLVEYRARDGTVETCIEVQADNDCPDAFEDHLDTLRQVLVESFPDIRFAGSILWRGEESVDLGRIAIEASGSGIVVFQLDDASGLPLAGVESAAAALAAAGRDDEFTTWLHGLIALQRAESGIPADAPD